MKTYLKNPMQDISQMCDMQEMPMMDMQSMYKMIEYDVSNDEYAKHVPYDEYAGYVSNDGYEGA